MVDVKDTPVTTTASGNIVVTATPDRPATHAHSNTHNPTDTTAPTNVKTASTTEKVNAPPPLTADQKDTLQLMQRTDQFLQTHFQMITQWQSTFP